MQRRSSPSSGRHTPRASSERDPSERDWVRVGGGEGQDLEVKVVGRGEEGGSEVRCSTRYPTSCHDRLPCHPAWIHAFHGGRGDGEAQSVLQFARAYQLFTRSVA